MATYFDKYQVKLGPNSQTPPGPDPNKPPSLPPEAPPVPGPSAPTDPIAFIRQWQQSHPASEGIGPLADALRAAGFDIGRFMYGNTPSNNELTINGQKFKVLSGENSGSPSWYFGGDDGGGSGFGEMPPFSPYDATDPFTYGDYTPGEFTAPDAEAMKQDPGYQFRLNEGGRNLDASAAARGTLRTGGHLKHFEKFTQDYASQEYEKAYRRAFETHGANESNRFNAYQANRANAYGNYVLNLQTMQFEWQQNNAGAMSQWAARYGMSQDELENLYRYAVLGQNAANNVPPPVPPAPTPKVTPFQQTPGEVPKPRIGDGRGRQAAPNLVPDGGLTPYGPNTYAEPVNFGDLLTGKTKRYA